jgi:hypothetical protein
MNFDPRIKAPTPATLTKYGLTEERWWEILESQGGVCPIMNMVPSTGRFVIDHEHVRNYKKLPPEERAQHVRGIVSWFANHAYMGRGISVDRAIRVALYLARYEGDITTVTFLEDVVKMREGR